MHWPFMAIAPNPTANTRDNTDSLIACNGLTKVDCVRHIFVSDLAKDACAVLLAYLGNHGGYSINYFLRIERLENIAMDAGFYSL